MKGVKVGLIGASGMGTFHSYGFSRVRNVYGDDIVPILEVVADIDEAKAKNLYKRFGYNKWTNNWKEVVDNPEIDLVIVATPNYTHAEIAIATANNGKNILCEKPMTTKLSDSKNLVKAVEKNGVISAVGFVYCYAPTQVFAKELMKSGKLGNLITFRGQFDMGWYADPNVPASWKCYKKYSGPGVLGDLTSHIISVSDFILELEIKEVLAVLDIKNKTRKDEKGENIKVETDDQLYVLVKYDNDIIGCMSSSRICVGKSFALGYEIHGTKGCLNYEGDRFNELKFYKKEGPEGEQGYKILKGNFAHGDYGKFAYIGDMGIAYPDVIAIQARRLIESIAKNKPMKLDVAYGYKVDRITEAIIKSSEENRWVKISEFE
jgi:predicted dehydrogenase